MEGMEEFPTLSLGLGLSESGSCIAEERRSSPSGVWSVRSSAGSSPCSGGGMAYSERPRCHRCGSAQRPAPLQPIKPWRRILFECQLYDDNYVDESFLSSMVTNANVRQRTFSSLVFDSLAVSMQFSIATIFFVVFLNLFRGWISAEVLVGVDIIMVVAGSFAKIVIDAIIYRQPKHEIYSMLSTYGMQFVMFTGLLLGLSPILMTLTSAYSDDTIWALTFIKCSVHVFMHDYTWLNSPHKNHNFEGPISLNAAVFASVLLASRLQSSTAVFSFVLFCFVLFAGLPFLARSMHRFSERLHVFGSLSIMSSAVIGLSRLSITASLAMVCTLIFINIVCPFWLKWIQRYKHEIQGPWDYDTENEIPGE